MATNRTAKLTFTDEFDSLSLWNGKTGTWSTSYEWQGRANGSTLPGEQQWYIDGNYVPTSSIKPWAVHDGVMTITADRASEALKAHIEGYDITSGQLNSQHSFHQTYGYFEIRAQMPDGSGAWPAFWLVNSDGTNTYELDVVEMIGSDTDALVTTLHDNSEGEGASAKVVKTASVTVADMASGFHTYGVDWQKEFISWYFDGKLVHQVATPEGMNKDMFMIVNLAVGGAMPGNIDPDGFTQAQMQVDYVHVYDFRPVDPELTGESAAVPLVDTTEVRHGTAGNDGWLASTGPTSEIYGGDGDDVVSGGGGNDKWLSGDAGQDTIYGGDGDDALSGGDGDDKWLSGDAGADTIYGGAGDDLIGGGDGHDQWLSGDAGDDQIWGGDGDDIISGGDGDDNWLSGDAGNDTIYGDAGNDLISGGAGDDNWLAGGDGNDQIWGDDGNDVVSGGKGDDEWLSGGNGNDVIYGDWGDDKLSGDAGDDYLVGGDGNDHYWGGQGNDTFVIDVKLAGKGVIHDFQLGVDRLQVEGFGGEIMKTAVADPYGVLFELDSNSSLQVLGVSLQQFQLDPFYGLA